MKKLKKPSSPAMKEENKGKLRKILEKVKDKEGKTKFTSEQIDTIVGSGPEESRIDIADRFKGALR